MVAAVVDREQHRLATCRAPERFAGGGQAGRRRDAARARAHQPRQRLLGWQVGKGGQLWDGEQEAAIIALRLGTPPKGFANWTLRLLAEQAVALEIVEAEGEGGLVSGDQRVDIERSPAIPLIHGAVRSATR